MIYRYAFCIVLFDGVVKAAFRSQGNKCAAVETPVISPGIQAI